MAVMLISRPLKLISWQFYPKLKTMLFSVNKYVAFINNSGKEEGGRKSNKSIKDVMEVNGSRV